LVTMRVKESRQTAPLPAQRIYKILDPLYDAGATDEQMHKQSTCLRLTAKEEEAATDWFRRWAKRC
jgi:hypothetical protein